MERFAVQGMCETDNLRRALLAMQPSAARETGFSTGLNVLDQIIPHQQIQSGAVHELLSVEPKLFPKSLALLLAKASLKEGGSIAWIDSELELYLPGFSAAGIDLRRLILVRVKNRQEQLWATAECLRCREICATISLIDRLTQIEARKLQLAAERGRGVGIFLRPYTSKFSQTYAAATRWLVQPMAGDRQVQRWNVQLIHGHGGQIGKIVLLEVNRATGALCVSEPLADRSAAPASRSATA
jgi:protein ImuA